ncbi:RNA 2',3'-cyclic phosphodiesterase [Thalassotalea aquiviva]|uniref:RNA 2',3'-cyclic phosphodiesterase n=1 Tax=Thalassotalea aquiviva TaxID=3242415 RepID=UPI00352A9AF4
MNRRVFFGLSPSAKSKTEIDQWRQQYLTHLNNKKLKPVAVENFHLTLFFIGFVDQKAFSKLFALGDTINAQPFSLTLNTLGLFKRPKVLYLGCQTIPTELQQLASLLAKQLGDLGFTHQHSTFVPHLTLCRKATEAVLAQQDFAFTLFFNDFCLYESTTVDDKVKYNILKRWSLQ